jgi:hypothetical protein
MLLQAPVGPHLNSATLIELDINLDNLRALVYKFVQYTFSKFILLLLAANEEPGTANTTVVQEFLPAEASIISTEISASVNNETVSASTSVTNASVAAAILTAANSVVQAVLYFILSS